MDDEAGQDTGRPVWFLLTDRPTDPVRWQRLMEGVHKARAQGAMVTAQVAGRPVGVMLGMDTALNPFSIRPSYQALLKLPAAERLKRLQDPAMRAQILQRGTVRRAGATVVAVPPADHHTVGSHVRRWAIRRTTSRRKAAASPPSPSAVQPHAGRGGLRLSGRRRWTVPVLPDRRLQRGQPRHHPHHADRSPATVLGLSRWRRALLLDQSMRACRAGC